LPAAKTGTDCRRRHAVPAAYQARPRLAVPDRRPAGMSSTPRKPSAFPISPEAVEAEGNSKAQDRPAPVAAAPRKPRAAAVEMAVAVPVEQDVFDVPDIAEAVPPPATAPRKRPLASRILLGAAGVLVSLGVGLWIDNL